MATRVSRIILRSPLDLVTKNTPTVAACFGPKRQIERELQRQDPYNYFYFEVEASRVR